MGGDLAVPSDVRALDTFVFARVGTSVERVFGARGPDGVDRFSKGTDKTREKKDMWLK